LLVFALMGSFTFVCLVLALLLVALGVNSTFLSTDPSVSACKTIFLGGTPPSNITSIHSGTTLVPLCHTNGKSVYFFTVYDPSVLHALASMSVAKYADILKATGGRRSFEMDPQLTSRKIPQVSPESKTSGYTTAWNRGHLGPSEDYSFDKSSGGAWQQCYFTTNIAPQWYQFNQIGWRLLEANVFQWSLKNKKDIYVITGTYYNHSTIRKLGNLGLSIPNYYYKVICDGTSSAAFTGANVQGSSGMEAMQYMTVSALQKITGINFQLPTACKTSVVDKAHWNFTHQPPSAPFLAV